jgi:heme/copper-type cytochrome/quinol oxidase subunit 3
MKTERVVMDVSDLPTVVFGSRDLMWWGTVGFMVIEGFSLAIVAFTYIYLRKNFVEWPPHGTPLPSLTIPSINMGLMLASIPLVWWTKRRGEHLDLKGLRIGLVLSSLVGIAVFGLRFFEFAALNTQWNSNAYASAIWFILGFHTTVMIGDVYDTIGLTAILFTRNREAKHYVAATDNAEYWIFCVLVWVPLYVMVFFGARIL